MASNSILKATLLSSGSYSISPGADAPVAPAPAATPENDDCLLF